MGKKRKPPTLDELGERLRAAQAERQGGAAGNGPGNPSGLGMAWRISIELVSAVLVGTGIGWVLDGWLGTRPWLMVVFLLLGGAAGVMNAYRAARGLDQSVGFGQAVRRQEERDTGRGDDDGA